jgi:hypothetical protein
MHDTETLGKISADRSNFSDLARGSVTEVTEEAILLPNSSYCGLRSQFGAGTAMSNRASVPLNCVTPEAGAHGWNFVIPEAAAKRRLSGIHAVTLRQCTRAPE